MEKLITLILGGLIFMLFTALLVMLFIYAGWNWGVVPAVTFAKDITLAQAFWLSLAISSVAGAWKSELKLKD